MSLEKRSISLSGHRTSLALEPAFWTALERIAAARTISLTALIASVDDARLQQDGLASALRVFALRVGSTSD